MTKMRIQAAVVKTKTFNYKDEEQEAKAWATKMKEKGNVVFEDDKGSDTYCLYAAPSKKDIQDWCEEQEQEVKLVSFTARVQVASNTSIWAILRQDAFGQGDAITLVTALNEQEAFSIYAIESAGSIAPSNVSEEQNRAVLEEFYGDYKDGYYKVLPTEMIG